MTERRPPKTSAERIEAWRQREAAKWYGRRDRRVAESRTTARAVGMYRDAATAIGLVPGDLDFFVANLSRLTDQMGLARSSSWPRKVLRVFRGQLGEIARGERKEIPPGMIAEMRAMLTGVMTDPSGNDVLVDARTAAKVAELFARVAAPGTLTSGTIDDHHAWDAAARERERQSGPTDAVAS